MDAILAQVCYPVPLAYEPREQLGACAVILPHRLTLESALTYPLMYENVVQALTQHNVLSSSTETELDCS